MDARAQRVLRSRGTPGRAPSGACRGPRPWPRPSAPRPRTRRPAPGRSRRRRPDPASGCRRPGPRRRCCRRLPNRVDVAGGHGRARLVVLLDLARGALAAAARPTRPAGHAERRRDGAGSGRLFPAGRSGRRCRRLPRRGFGDRARHRLRGLAAPPAGGRSRAAPSSGRPFARAAFRAQASSGAAALRRGASAPALLGRPCASAPPSSRRPSPATALWPPGWPRLLSAALAQPSAAAGHSFVASSRSPPSSDGLRPAIFLAIASSPGFAAAQPGAVDEPGCARLLLDRLRLSIVKLYRLAQ